MSEASKAVRWEGLSHLQGAGTSQLQPIVRCRNANSMLPDLKKKKKNLNVADLEVFQKELEILIFIWKHPMIE